MPNGKGYTGYKEGKEGKVMDAWEGECRIGEKIEDIEKSMSKDMNMLKYCKGKDVLNAAYGCAYESNIMETIRKNRKVL